MISWIVGVQEANLDHSFVSKFCELLMIRVSPLGEGSLSPREWAQQKQILLKYVQVSCAYIAQQQAIAEARMDEVSPHHPCLQVSALGGGKQVKDTKLLEL